MLRFLILAVSLFATAAAGQTAPPVNVGAAVERPIVRAIRVSGTVTSPSAAVLSPSVGGLVAHMNVDAGDQVSAGDVLVVLDAELQTLELRRREAELQQAEAALADSRRRLDEAERVRSANAISESEIESRRATAVRDAAALAAARAAVQQQRSVVDRLSVKAPFAGVIGRRIAAVGEWVNTGDGLVELVATDDLRFDFRVPQEYFGDISMQTVVELESDALPGFAADGHIIAIVPVKDPGSRTFLVRAQVNGETASSVTPGMSTRGILHVDARRNGIVVSRDALLRYPDGRQVVWIIDDSAEIPVVRERQVQTGLMFEGLVEIRSGLDAGSTVVTRGNETLQEGQQVSIREQAPGGR
ncbi:MAG: efflux RND transporter periplasmic adaptor subunit [Gammaproteobacteria bacterium]|nr:efflux RND transporter periplasmic adaptor subunit [Gammaproteobacteria bacterium]